MKDSISVVIPAYNEEKRLEKTLRSITSYLKKNNDRILQNAQNKGK